MVERGVPSPISCVDLGPAIQEEHHHVDAAQGCCAVKWASAKGARLHIEPRVLRGIYIGTVVQKNSGYRGVPLFGSIVQGGSAANVSGIDISPVRQQQLRQRGIPRTACAVQRRSTITRLTSLLLSRVRQCVVAADEPTGSGHMALLNSSEE